MKKYFAAVLIFCAFAICQYGCTSSTETESEEANTAVGRYGLIHVKGNAIVDKNQDTVALYGMSLFWSQWGGKYFNESCIKWLKSDWNCTIVRAAMGIEAGGYLTNPDAEMAKVTSVIDACIKNGLYVIVDWHDHHAQEHLKESKEFFGTIAKKYGSKHNLIYELYNEPLQVSWTGVIKPYAEEVIKEIRQYDPDNLIIIGSPNWSQDVDVAAKDPIKDENLAYSFHFYTSTHDSSLRAKAISAMENGAPLFVTEYGISEASGNGKINYTETEKWLTFVQKYKLSTCNWSVMDKEETSAALKPGTDGKGSWKEEDLSESGKFIRSYIRKLNAGIFSTFTQKN